MELCRTIIKPIRTSAIFLIGKGLLHSHPRCYSLRHANLGQVTEYLTKEGVPNILQKNLDDEYLNDDIKLRLLPTTHPYFPVLSGKSKYKASMNAIRLLTNKLILTRKSQVRITSAITLLKDKEDSILKARNFNCCTKNDKLVIKWQSCSSKEECDKLIIDVSGKVTPFPKMKDSKPPFLEYVLDPPSKPISGEAVRAQVKSLNSKEIEDGSTSRIIKGVFIFEFNEDNSQVIVHTIEEIEMIDYEKKVPTGAFAC